jgi:hypothetical protein
MPGAIMSKRKTSPARQVPPLSPDDEKVGMVAWAGGVRPQVRKVTEEKFDLARKRAFLDILRRTANVRWSAKAVGIAPNTTYRHRQRYPQFELEWLDAQEHAVNLLEATLLQRALRYNMALTEANPEGGDDGVAVESFSNGDAMRLIKLHRESITARRIEVAARMRQSPNATYKQLSEKLEGIYQRILARDKAANDAPV